MSTRVAITGIGLVTPLGNDRESTWKSILEGQSGVGPVTLFDASRHDVRIAAEVKDFDPLNYIDRKLARRTDRFSQFALAAAKEAIEDSNLDIASMPDDVGVIVGSGSGGLWTLEEGFHVVFEKGPDRFSPFFITMQPADMAGANISMLYGARGHNYATVSACATGAHAIGEAAEVIRRGDARAVIAGGSEAGITPMSLAAFASMHALSSRNDDPQHASRPFDNERDGFVMGEGAGVLILEDLELARARGAKIYAEVIGYSATSDAHHVTEPAPGGAGLARALRRALKKAELAPEDVDYINAHGTSTKFNDRDETAAIKAVFGEQAGELAISSTKSMTGHMLGAAGGLEIGLTALALKNRIMPPTINYQHPDPECDLDYIPNEARHKDISVAISNSMGFGGHNAVAILKRYAD
ncbi:MAG TPA: beta-ketoacyl-ACP synthase II [Ktedonobacterales bacterium]|jgi:3-oxoacyl-[acyl-carrier-protein] synthase II|nr:beta-ketoacyl-ACP synthase II [Ktedonobacterales bacterium]